MSVKHYKELIVWQKSMDLVVLIYAITKQLPKDELYGLSSQMRRAAISIPSNIAEGSERGTSKDFAQFLRIADGSSSELETQLLICERLFPNIDTMASRALIDEIQRMLDGLMKSIR